ncbi:MAG: hypothetical protein K2Z81_18150, partial [Cyanobacteria bacterium]|nr:hypothetical protein [Cyanobacteriota bacterium]
TISRDFMLFGKKSPGTILEDGNYFFGSSQEVIDDTFANMTDADRGRLRRGLDMHMTMKKEGGDEYQRGQAIATRIDALPEGERAGARDKLTKEERSDLTVYQEVKQAKALLDKTNTSAEAKAARNDYEYFTDLYHTVGRLSTFAQERRRLEYLSQAAGAGFNKDMGESVVGTFWNASTEEHMKHVEAIDRESFDLFVYNRSLRQLNEQFMNTHFNYEGAGKRATELLTRKLNYADSIMNMNPSEVKSLLPGTRDLSTTDFDGLLASRALDQKIERGAGIQAEISRGKLLTEQIAEGERIARDISAGTLDASKLPDGDKKSHQLYLDSQANKLSPADQKALARYNLDKENKPPADAGEAEALKAFRENEKNDKLVGEISEGRKLAADIDAGRHMASQFQSGRKLSESLQGMAPDVRDAKIKELSKEERASLALFERDQAGKLTVAEKAQLKLFNDSEAGKLGANQTHLLEQYRQWQRLEGTDVDSQYTRGQQVERDLLAVPVAERAKARAALSDADRNALKTYSEVEGAKKLAASIEAGRLVSEGGLPADQLTAEQRTQLSLYNQYQAGRLPPAQANAMRRLEAMNEFKNNPEALALSGEVADRLRQTEALRTYREDASGLKSFLDGQAAARELKDAGSEAKQQALLERWKTEPGGQEKLGNLDRFRQTTYDLTQQNVRRDLVDALSDAKGYVWNDYNAMYNAIA